MQGLWLYKVKKNNRNTAVKYLTQLTFLTVRESGDKRQYGPFGLWSSIPFEVSGNIFSFYGRSGGEGEIKYKIGVYYSWVEKFFSYTFILQNKI